MARMKLIPLKSTSTGRISFPQIPWCALKNNSQMRRKNTDFRDTLAVLATVKDGPGNAARVLALEEEGLGLSILEAEDLAVAADVQLTLYIERILVYFHCIKATPYSR